MSEVLIRQEKACGHITLNRPGAMNALTLKMVWAIYQALCGWRIDPDVQFVLMDGAGDRGLCAGGDIRALYQHALSGNLSDAARFLREEYRLNLLIAEYPKPYVALMDGVVMGGGVGVSAHGTQRVVTDRTVLAMPETGIGFIPDVGGTYLLGNAPDELGTYLGLTGRRIGAADAILCGLADVFVPSERLPHLTASLIACDTRSDVSQCLRAFAETAPTGKLESRKAWIDACFCADSVEDILVALETSLEKDAAEAAADIRRNSPTALKVTLRAFRRGRQLRDLTSCLQQEYSAGMHCILKGDFVEGVRAAVIDKDRTPIWHPRTLQEVSTTYIDSFLTESAFPSGAENS